MEWVETTGRTVEEAKDAALDQLGVDDTDAEFVIVAEPRPGLFGRMRGEARVRARVVPTSPRPKRGRSRRQDQRRSGGRGRSAAGSGRGGADAGSAVAVAEPEVEEGPAGSSSNGSRQAAAGGGAGTGTRRRSRGGRGRGRGSGQPREQQTEDQGQRTTTASGEGEPAAGTQGLGRGSSRTQRPRADDGAKEEPVGEELSLEEQGEAARAFIAGLVDELGLEAEVSTKVIDEDTVEVAVDGGSLGILIGPGGATLAALQELARTVVQKRTGGHSDRILVEVAGYRAKRAEALQRFTRQIADEVLASGTERALEPMSAADRKVVHDTVNEISGVATRSEGEDPRRHIVISPVSSDPQAPVQEPADD